MASVRVKYVIEWDEKLQAIVARVGGKVAPTILKRAGVDELGQEWPAEALRMCVDGLEGLKPA